MKALLCVLVTQCVFLINAHNITKTEVFVIHLKPSLFNWTYEGSPDQFVYQPSLLHYPDLPSWINYYYSHNHLTGYLYGVPPDNLYSDVHIEVVALNRKTYETKHQVITIRVNEKLNPAKNEVHLKIDNLNVEDMFDHERIERLKNVFRRTLWKESSKDMHLTFLASAIQLGARLPPNPNEGEGVVLRIGSKAHLSSELTKLQKEVKPLWKHTSCPRDFKRTTVERFFRTPDLRWIGARFGCSRESFDRTSTHEVLSHYTTIHNTNSMKGLSTKRDISCLSPELVSRNHPDSPSLGPRGIHCRPSPPPYIRPKFKPDL
ncbi:hypothetical protein FQR65_LT12547 [Abscondita terminalis]|nr:hypothetical protein FQR65_LT12547 [Abscondita terminalis]